MEFREIEETDKIKAISNGRVMIGSVDDFQKIYMEHDRKSGRPVRTCGGCKSPTKQ